jgi:hypothetical protein
VTGKEWIFLDTVPTVISNWVVLSGLLFAVFSERLRLDGLRDVVYRVSVSTVGGDGNDRSRRGVLDLKPKRKEFQRCRIRNNRKGETRKPGPRA